MQVAPVSLHRPVAPEDQTRADLYAVLARLFADAPDAKFLATLGGAERLADSLANPVAAAWNRLLDASAAMDAGAAAQEYTNLFIGVGKSDVNLHASHWESGFMMEKPLADLRGELDALGLSRKGAATMLEDHLAALCETMRIMILGVGDRRPSSMTEQRNFFQKRLLPWIFDCCAAIEKSSLANYYRRVAEFTTLFMALERDSIAME
jgi:TorA maturation chaperone TorD